MPTFPSRVRRRIAAGALAICALAAPAQAANFTIGNNNTTIAMSGDIEETDAGVLQDIVESIEENGFRVQWLFLNSPGGRTQGGVDLAKVVFEHKLGTVVRDQNTCASSCVTVFALGARRVVFPTARIGVHSGSELNLKTGESRYSPDATLKMIQLYHSLGVPDSVLIKIAITPPEQMAWLNVDEYRAWGVEMYDPNKAASVPSNRRPLY